MRDANHPAPNLHRAAAETSLSWEQYVRDLMEGKGRSYRDRALFFLLCFLSIFYGLALRLRSFAYRVGLFRSFRLPKPVISVGNLTVGGTGKTPTAALIAKYFLERGKRVVVLSRGYGGSLHRRGEHIVSDGVRLYCGAEEAGDEPYLLATSMPGLMVVVGAARYRAGLLAMRELRPDIFLLDDGFQHLSMKRDLNILLLDCRRPLHNGRTLPAGLLREPASAAKRADLVIYTRCGGTVPEATAAKPFCAADHQLTAAVSLADGSAVGFAQLRGRRGMAFAGIADPTVFFDSLEREGLTLVTTLAFPDHSSYGDDEITSILRLMKAARSDYLMTTAKDAVKLSAFQEQLGEIWYARLEIELHNSVPLHTMLNKLL